MRPVLALLSDGQEQPVQAIRDALAQQFALSDEELEERLPSGRQRTYTNRVAWALAHLKGAAIVESPRRGVYRVTERGQQLLAQIPETERVDLRVLARFDEYRQFRSQGDVGPVVSTSEPDDVDGGTPTERMQMAYRELRAAVVADVLERVREQTPDFFEQVVLDVLQA